MVDLNLHLILFVVAGISMVLIPLVIGRFVRPVLHTPEKDAVYECGEPTIGSSYIQFDLRFYVVALLFIVFDVEVVFFFPWAVIFGSATQLSDPRLTDVARTNITAKLLDVAPSTINSGNAISANTGYQLAQLAMCDLLVFFAVLLVGFAYVWKRGDLDWVRSMIDQAKVTRAAPIPIPAPAVVAPNAINPVA